MRMVVGVKTEEKKRALAAHLQQTKPRDVLAALVLGVLVGFTIWLIFGTGGVGHSGGISPSMTQQVEWPIFGALAGLVSAGVSARAFYSHKRQRRRKQFWDQELEESNLTRGL